MTDLAVEPRASRRRLLRRLLLAPVVGIVAASITIIVWLLLAYNHLANDLSSSRARLPHSAFATLAPRGRVLEKPQITVAIVRERETRTAPILFRSDPDRRAIALLPLPIVSGATSEPAIVRNVSRLVGADINHILVLTPTALASTIDAVGPISIHNPRPVDYLGAGAGWHFPAGVITLDGTHALAFMSGTSETTTAARAQLLLDGVVRDLLSRSTVSELKHALDSITASAATDLTASDLLGLAWLRFRSETFLRCNVAKEGEPGAALSSAELRVFLGRTGSRAQATATGCHATALRASSIPLPPKGVVTAIGWIYPHILALALGFFGAGLLIAAALIVGPRNAWTYLNRLRRRSRGAAAARRAETLARAQRLRSAGAIARRWLAINRGEIYVYTFAILISVTLALVVVGWAV